MRLPNPFRITRDESPVACVLNPVSCHELSIGFLAMASTVIQPTEGVDPEE